MTEASPDPITRPNSTRGRLPLILQLRFVNAGLEKNPHPRKHYERQFSITPERQTPESQQTPLIVWTEPDPIEELEDAKARARDEAERLEKFYAGRLLLREEEPERYGIFGEDPEYWCSQIDHWESEYEKLAKEYDRRKQLEAEGKVHEGFAQALLFSPIQSPSPSPPNGLLGATATGIKKYRPTAVRPSKQAVTTSSSQRRLKRLPQLSPLTLEDKPSIITRASRRLKYTGKEKKQDVEKESIVQRTDPTPKTRQHRVTKRARRPRKNTSKVSKTPNNKVIRQGILWPRSPWAPRVLPWTLRSMKSISYRETGTRVGSKKKRPSGGGRASK